MEELESQVKVIVQQEEQKEKRKIEQKGAGDMDIKHQSERSEIIERKKKWKTEIFPRKSTRKFPTHEEHRASKLKGPSKC